MTGYWTSARRDGGTQYFWAAVVAVAGANVQHLALPETPDSAGQSASELQSCVQTGAVP